MEKKSLKGLERNIRKSKYSLKITPKASEDLDGIYNYISNELFNEKTAVNLMDKIETNIMGLKDFPLYYNFVNDEILSNKGYRKIIIDNDITFYIVNEVDKQVVIMRVIYGRQNIKILYRHPFQWVLFFTLKQTFLK